MFSAADKASLVAQHRYLLATKSTLLLLMGGAILDAIAGELDSYKTFLAITGAVLFFISLALSVYVKSAKMRDMRATPFAERKKTYLNGRVKDQRQWYGVKAKANRWAGEKYFVLVIICQLLAASSSLAGVRWPDARVHFTGLFAALAS